MNTGVIGPGSWQRGRAAAGGIGPAVRAPLGLGVKRAPNPVASRKCGTWKPLPGSERVLGRPTARRAENPGGNRMPKKRMRAAERRQETRGYFVGPSADRRGITGRIPALGGPLRKGADVGR